MQLASRQVADPAAQQNFDQLAAQLTPPHARVHNTTDQPIANNTTEYLTFDTVDWDENGMQSAADRLTAVRAGLHIVTVHVRWDGAPFESGECDAWIEHSSLGERATDGRANSFISQQMPITDLIRFEKGDYAQVGVYQNSGGAMTVKSVGTRTPAFAMTWMSD